jgi:hypothetical protein
VSPDYDLLRNRPHRPIGRFGSTNRKPCFFTKHWPKLMLRWPTAMQNSSRSAGSLAKTAKGSHFISQLSIQSIHTYTYITYSIYVLHHSFSTNTSCGKSQVAKERWCLRESLGLSRGPPWNPLVNRLTSLWIMQIHRYHNIIILSLYIYHISYHISYHHISYHISSSKYLGIKGRLEGCCHR